MIIFDLGKLYYLMDRLDILSICYCAEASCFSPIWYHTFVEVYGL